jgi:hypothetical protein
MPQLGRISHLLYEGHCPLLQATSHSNDDFHSSIYTLYGNNCSNVFAALHQLLYDIPVCHASFHSDLCSLAHSLSLTSAVQVSVTTVSW